VDVFVNEELLVTGRTDKDVLLPDAATLGGFDTLLVELEHHCDPLGPEGSTCDHWDGIQTLYMCDPGDPSSCRNIEVARHITTYWREARRRGLPGRAPRDRRFRRLPQADRQRHGGQPERHLVV